MRQSDGHITTIHGEVPNPIQILDSSSSECLLAACLARDSRSDAFSQFPTQFRACVEDGAASNKKYEREGAKLHWPGSVYVYYGLYSRFGNEYLGKLGILIVHVLRSTPSKCNHLFWSNSVQMPIFVVLFWMLFASIVLFESRSSYQQLMCGPNSISTLPTSVTVCDADILAL